MQNKENEIKAIKNYFKAKIKSNSNGFAPHFTFGISANC